MWINLLTMTYPLNELEIREENKETAFALPFSPPAHYAYVFPSPKPSQEAIEVAPVMTAKGHWEQRWENSTCV